MSFRSQFDVTGENQIRGERAESLFDLEARRRGYKVSTVDGEDNYKHHIDKRIWNRERNEFFNVQVKALKKISRSDNQLTDEIVWIEFVNVKGYSGWIYGTFDIIAFERVNDFIIVDRLDLIELCERLVNFNETVYSSAKAVYKIYTRQGRRDKISLIKMKDIESLSNTIWMKSNIIMN